METKLWAIGLILVATLIGAFGPIFFKKASKNFRMSIKALLTNYSLMIGVALYGVSTVLFVPALKGGDLSVLYPFVAIGYIWVCFLSVKFLNEKMSLLKWAGIIAIIVGVSFIGLGS